MKKKLKMASVLSVLALGTLLVAGAAQPVAEPVAEANNATLRRAANVDAGKEISIVTTAGQTYTVQGLVVATNSRAAVIYDGEDGIMIYGSGVLNEVSIGDFIEITAEASSYNNLLQFSYGSDTAITILSEGAPVESDAVALTADIANGWKTGANAGTLSVSDVQRYTWTATATKDGNFWVLDPEGMTLDFAVEPLYVNSADFHLEENTKYDVTGYFIGFDTRNNYAGIMLQSLEVASDQIQVSFADEYVALDNPGTSVYDMGVVVTGDPDNLGYTLTSSNDDVATASGANLIVRGTVGTTTITATSNADPTKSAQATLVVYSGTTAINQISAAGTYSVQGIVKAKTDNSAIVMSTDFSAGIMVYDVKQISDLAINDIVRVSGTTSEYNSLQQFSYNPGVVVDKVSSLSLQDTSTSLTETLLQNWSSGNITQSDVKKYSWTAVAGLDNGFDVYNLSYDGIKVESVVDLPNVELGKTYDLTGYLAGYNTNNDYVAFVIDSVTEAATQQDYLGFNRDAVNLGIGGTYKLSPIVGGVITTDMVSYSGYDSTIISIAEDGTITGLTGGTTTITASAGTITRTITVMVSSAISQVTEDGGFYTVVGKVVAETTQSVVIHDGSDGILVYDRNLPSQYDIGDILQVSGYVSDYNGMLQFSYSGSLEVTEVTGTIDVPAPVALTAAKVQDWKAQAQAGIIPVSECQAYTWTTTAGLDGSFTLINLDGCDINIEPAYLLDSIDIQSGSTYTVTAYFIGYSLNHDYAAVAVTGATLVA